MKPLILLVDDQPLFRRAIATLIGEQPEFTVVGEAASGLEAIEQALLTAYHKTPGAQETARVTLDRKTGHVNVLVREVDEEGNASEEYDDTPAGFGRIAATTAKQIMLQRLRDAEDDIRFGEFSGKEGDIISGIIQQGRNPDDVMVGRWNKSVAPFPTRWQHVLATFTGPRADNSRWRHLRRYVLPVPWIDEHWRE